MSSIRKLANQTLWYGGSYVAARFLNVLLKFVLIYLIPMAAYGEMTKVYAYTTFLTVLFTYGMETAYFRFVQGHPDKRELFNTSFTSILVTTLFFSAAMWCWAQGVADLWKVASHPEWVRWFAVILGFDTLAAIPFAKLRQEQRPVKYAFLKFVNILLQVLFSLYFLALCPWMARHHPASPLLHFYDPSIGVGYVFVANMIASIVTLALLGKELRGFRLRPDARLWRQLLVYGLPLAIVGFGGMINDVVDRLLLDYLLPYSQDVKNVQIAIYQAAYLFAMPVNIFIQIFRMGAEPFFFNESGGENAPVVYARVMKFFVIGTAWLFLAIVLFRDVWVLLLDVGKHPAYREAMGVVPELALAYVCLGIYYNLAIWYKLTDRTRAGATITLIGTVVTLALNVWWIPHYSYVGCAWASLACYVVMMIISYVWGQKHYPVPYEWKKLTGYLAAIVVIFLVHQGINTLAYHRWLSIATGLVLLGGFMVFTLVNDRKEFSRLPVIGRYLG